MLNYNIVNSSVHTARMIYVDILEIAVCSTTNVYITLVSMDGSHGLKTVSRDFTVFVVVMI